MDEVELIASEEVVGGVGGGGGGGGLVGTNRPSPPEILPVDYGNCSVRQAGLPVLHRQRQMHRQECLCHKVQAARRTGAAAVLEESGLFLREDREELPVIDPPLQGRGDHDFDFA
jgi:hypothetical protein